MEDQEAHIWNIGHSPHGPYFCERILLKLSESFPNFLDKLRSICCVTERVAEIHH
jgi:hypothetical protein